MGQSVKELRERIRGVGNIQKITRAMEMVATTKLRRLQARAEGARPYADTIRRFSALLANAGAGAMATESPLTRAHETVRRQSVLVVSSDRGLCGAYNAHVCRKVTAFLGEQEGREPELFVLGKKATAYFAPRLPIREAFPDVVEKMDYRRVLDISRQLTRRFLDGSAQDGSDEVWLVYTRFVSLGRQIPTVEKLLPIEPAQDDEAAGATPDILLEPTPEVLLEKLLPKSLVVRLYAALLDSLASEYAARRMAMKAATDAAGEMLGDLRRRYNRARQEAITKELLDIVGGAEALQ